MATFFSFCMQMLHVQIQQLTWDYEHFSKHDPTSLRSFGNFGNLSVAETGQCRAKIQEQSPLHTRNSLSSTTHLVGPRGWAMIVSFYPVGRGGHRLAETTEIAENPKRTEQRHAEIPSMISKPALTTLWRTPATFEPPSSHMHDDRTAPQRRND